MTTRTIFVTGATGFLGRATAEALLERGHTVTALARAGSEDRVPAGAQLILGDAIDPHSYRHAISASDTFLHLVGTPHPGPGRNPGYRTVDLRSVDVALEVAINGGVGHFVYVSVAQPAPLMWHYIAVRQVAEDRIRASGIPATILRPWYVLGPGRRWPGVLLPLYALCECLPATRPGAQRLGMVTRKQMVCALVAAIEAGPGQHGIIDVPAIRAMAGKTLAANSPG